MREIEEAFQNGKLSELNYIDYRLNELREPLLQKLLADVSNPNVLSEKEHGYLNAIEDVVKIVRDRKGDLR
ncbi:hypothetical protein [Streptococcus sobrinus]|uniref:hypothetical protein n=1 Tax=Streptococcus sobrinus TaxID=1310 RepID=UPI0003168AFB|nr:hypothetical protein [Streptococcus sobrinus]